ncbi:type I secretion C-terminal target domain-containing protein [Cycloclasticus pugetii]|uniref:type I secretion C-terminal target domain-containing protein n=1 Tax=Cycloclasticus pugetii TaxID=34068 RepID=UPI00036ADA8B|nr:type I secretion C-terminal target domain-containing protein [Cycloclasticus pugetii]
MANDVTSNEPEALDLLDLLVDESNDILSDYVSISLETLSEGTKISVTTVEDQPATYSSTLTGVTLTDLHCLVDVPTES